MPRVASALLLFGSALVGLAWLVQPAASSPQAVGQVATTPADVGDEADVEAVTLDRLQEPAREPPYTRPDRNPFSFAARETPPRAIVVSRDETPVRVARPRPTLVAVLGDASPDGPRYRAVLSADALRVSIVAAGESFAGFAVVAVREDAVTLRDASSDDVVVLRLH